MMRKYYIILFVMIVSANFFAQGLQIKSPESYAFEKFGNVPVNLYTGSIDLKIPIFKNDLVNIFLSYDSSGYIPHKKSNLAGMNWTLVAGGRVTRSIKQVPDDHEGENGSYIDLYNGFLKGVRNTPYSNSQVYDINNGGAGKVHPLLNIWYLGNSFKYETEPDVFNFNVMDLHGKFMIGNDGNVLVESDTPNIKVDLTKMKPYGNWFCSVPFTEIKITDGNGNQYFFGGDVSNLELYYPKSIPTITETGYESYETSVSNKILINAFSLSKIIFSSGKTVEFKYVKENFINDNWCMYIEPYDYYPNSKLFSLESYFIYKKNLVTTPTLIGGTPTEIRNHYGLIKKSLLDSIKFDNNKIKINYKDAGYPIKHYVSVNPDFHMIYPNETLIDNIQVFFNNTLVQQNTFSYEDWYISNSEQRPFLKKVKEENTNKEYSFEYYKDYLPTYYTKSIDHWGYFNNNYSVNNSGISPIPFDTYDLVTGDYTLNNTVRDPVGYFNLGQLKKVIYPTKGFTTFEYESPTYGKRIERNSSSMFLPVLTNNGGFTGGSRIKKQYDFSYSGVVENEKEYKYTTKIDNQNSSGILMNWPRYMAYFKFNDNGYIATYYNADLSNIQETSLDSYNIGYSKVFEINKNKGVILHNFYSYLDKPDVFTESDNIRTIDFNNNVIITPHYLFRNLEKSGIDKSILRGRLKSKIIYDANMKPLKKIEQEYTDNIDFNPSSTKDNNNYVAINHVYNRWFVQGYKRYLNPSYLKKQIETSYLNGDSIKITSEYFYNSNIHLNLSREKVTLPDNTMITKDFTYAEDIGDNLLMSANMKSIPLKITTSKNNIPISKTETNYPTTIPTIQTGNLILPLSVQSTRAGTISMAASPSGEVKDTEMLYKKYDEKGNMLEYVLKPDTNGNGTPVTIVWGYNQTLPIAKIEGAKYDDVKILQTIIDAVSASNSDTDQTSENTLINKLDLLRKDNLLSTYQITTYTHNPLIGITSITPPSGIREIYQYDQGNRLEKIVDVNGNILKEFHYKYAPQSSIVFFNTALNGIFTKNNCPEGFLGGSYSYSVPFGKYISYYSQYEVDQLAQNDFDTNGQMGANLINVCNLMNCSIIKGSTINNLTSQSLNINPDNHSELIINLSYQYNETLPWETTGIVVAKINGNCNSVNDRFSECFSNNTSWDIHVYPNGDINVKKSVDGNPAPPSGAQINLNFTIPIN